MNLNFKVVFEDTISSYLHIITGCQRGSLWCTDSSNDEGGYCCSQTYDCSLEDVRLLSDHERIATRSPVCWYKGGTRVGDVNCALAAPSAKGAGTTCDFGMT